MSDSLDSLWRKKLFALLHDPPDKCWDTSRRHEERAKQNQIAAGFTDADEREALAEEIRKVDHFASAAERFGFPRGKCSHAFAEAPLFRHPLSSEEYCFPPDFGERRDHFAGHIQAAHGGMGQDIGWRERFFLYWRRWPENAAAPTLGEKKLSRESDYAGLAFLPADSRIPDHSIWNHMAVAAALAPCVKDGGARPELLLFQFAPVQEFIAQARSCRDLWSGSYLISWLMAHAIKAVTDAAGPDAVIFPSLRGNGIFDALHRETHYAKLWETGADGKQSTWRRLIDDKSDAQKAADWLLTPTLPNRFLAVLPPGRGRELAKKAGEAIRGELAAIGGKVWEWLMHNGADKDWKNRYDAQILAFPQTAWAVQPWLDREPCLAETAKIDSDLVDRVKKMYALAEEKLPIPDRDPRYYQDGDVTKPLKNSGILWSAHCALVAARLAARRNTRDFHQWNSVGADAVKDSLSGREECVGDEKFWEALTKNKNHKKLFTAESHRYGAMNLIKRLWCRDDFVPYLREKLDLSEKHYREAMRFDDTREIAAKGDGKYIAILALDGDEMGKWLSGGKMPKFLDQLAPKALAYLRDHADAEPRRLLTPSYHLQFSEALANFAIHRAREVVEGHDGELLYAGGDDVLAILPSTRAIACARELRAAFREDYRDGRLLPGSKCDLSCGLAIGHYKAPLQMLVEEARKAELRAKNNYGRAALAISLYKRSGEIIHWGCKWKVKGEPLDLMPRLTELVREEKLSGRFPYTLAALLQPYKLEDGKNVEPGVREIVKTEVAHALSRQGANLTKGERGELAGQIAAYLDSMEDRHLGDFINLFLAETFINRPPAENLP
jgi:CRISPR-associated protein Cas10/Cmr2 subtype III-B